MTNITVEVPIRLCFCFFQHLGIPRIHRDLKLQAKIQTAQEAKKRREKAKWREKMERYGARDESS